MSDVTEGVVELWNRNHYTNASRYAIRWELKEDDKVIQSGDLALSTAPLSQELVHIPYKKPALIPGKEYRLMLHAVLKKMNCGQKPDMRWHGKNLNCLGACHALRKKRLKAYLPIHFRRKNWLSPEMASICIQPYRRTTDVDGCSRYGTAGITAPAESLACPAGQ